jgi:hypothetical protein
VGLQATGAVREPDADVGELRELLVYRGQGVLAASQVATDSRRQLGRAFGWDERIADALPSRPQAWTADRPTRRIAKPLSCDGPRHTAGFRGQIERDRIGHSDAVEARFSAKEGEDCSRRINELIRTVSSERHGVGGRRRGRRGRCCSIAIRRRWRRLIRGSWRVAIAGCECQPARDQQRGHYSASGHRQSGRSPHSTTRNALDTRSSIGSRPPR